MQNVSLGSRSISLAWKTVVKTGITPLKGLYHDPFMIVNFKVHPFYFTSMAIFCMCNADLVTVTYMSTLLNLKVYSQISNGGCSLKLLKFEIFTSVDSSSLKNTFPHLGIEQKSFQGEIRAI